MEFRQKFESEPMFNDKPDLEQPNYSEIQINVYIYKLCNFDSYLDKD